MSSFKPFYRRFSILVGAFIIFSQNSPVSGQEGGAIGDRSEVQATVSVKVSWNKHDEHGGNLEDKGSMSSSVSGVLVKSQDRSGVFLFVPESAGMHATVKYHNVRTYKKTGKIYLMEDGSGNVEVLSPQSLGDPQSQGHLELMAMTGPGGIAHALQLGGEVDPFTVMEMMKSGENKDHYSFSVTTPIKTIITDEEGKSKEGLRGIHFALIAGALNDGTINSSAKWTSDKVKPLIGYQSFMGTKYEPPKSGDVEYAVNWTFGEIPPVAEIQREVNGEWVNITDETVKAVVGEKIKLRGVVRPENKDPGTGTWTLEGGGTGRNYIERYEANISKGEVIDLKNLNTKELEFYWVDGGAATVEYTAQTDVNKASAEAGFEIRKPEYRVTINASGETKVQPPERGERLDQNECWGEGAYSAASPDDLWLQYQGIRFKAENLDRAEISGSERWVQIITKQFYYQTWDGVRSEEYITKALDVCYPSWEGPRGGDFPGILLERDGKCLTRKLSNGTEAPMTYTGKTQENRVYLMFKPDGEESEWVPVKVFDWTWVGNAQYLSIDADDPDTRGWTPKDCEIIPKQPEAVDTSEYPEWKKNAGDNSQYSSSPPGP